MLKQKLKSFISFFSFFNDFKNIENKKPLYVMVISMNFSVFLSMYFMEETMGFSLYAGFCFLVVILSINKKTYKENKQNTQH